MWVLNCISDVHEGEMQGKKNQGLDCVLQKNRLERITKRPEEKLEAHGKQQYKANCNRLK